MIDRAGRGVVLYDFLYVPGGAEQVTLELARGLEADICCDFRSRGTFPDEVVRGIRVHELATPTERTAWRTLRGLWDFRRKTGFIRDYDWALFSGSNAPVAVHHRREGPNLYYCHTPPRFAYDLLDYYLTSLPRWQRPALLALAALVRRQFAAAMARMDRIVANSRNVQERLHRYLGKESVVVHPPCDSTGYRWLGQGDYYLSTARLEPYKRVETVIEAFARMPAHTLVVTSGGSQYEALRRAATNASNIAFTGWVGRERLRELVGNAIATVYIPRDEDFGLSPLESMAAGKPVIGVAQGGLLETVVPNETGLLLPAEPSVGEVMAAVEQMTPKRALAMREACEARAQLFSRERFLEQMQAVVSEIMHDAPSATMNTHGPAE